MATNWHATCSREEKVTEPLQGRARHRQKGSRHAPFWHKQEAPTTDMFQPLVNSHAMSETEKDNFLEIILLGDFYASHGIR